MAKLCSRYYVCYTICRLFVLFCIFCELPKSSSHAVCEHSLELCTGTNMLECITGKPDISIKSRFLFPYLKGVLTLHRKNGLAVLVCPPGARNMKTSFRLVHSPKILWLQHHIVMKFVQVKWVAIILLMFSP